MKTLDLTQLTVETFDIDSAVFAPMVPIEPTDQVPNCDGITSSHC